MKGIPDSFISRFFFLIRRTLLNQLLLMGMLLLVLYRSNFRLQNLFSIGIVPRPYIGSRGSKSLIIDPSDWLERERSHWRKSMMQCGDAKGLKLQDLMILILTSIYIYIKRMVIYWRGDFY